LKSQDRSLLQPATSPDTTIRPWQTLDQQIALENRWLRVRRDRCRTPRGVEIGDYYVVEKPDFSMIAALTDAGEILLIREYKHGIGRVVWQLPAGYLSPGEEAAANARRELQEETGYQADHWQKLGTWAANSGLLNNYAHVFLATGLRQTGGVHWDDTEEIAVRLVPLTIARGMVFAGEIADPFTCLAILILADSLGRSTKKKLAG